MNIILRLLVNATVAYLLANFLSGVHIKDFKTAIVFSLVLGLLNVLVKPILIILTIPATILTLGLFLLVINAIMILMADKLMGKLVVDGFWWALLFGSLLPLISTFVFQLFDKKG
jgi:putative membrane protein